MTGRADHRRDCLHRGNRHQRARWHWRLSYCYYLSWERQRFASRSGPASRTTPSNSPRRSCRPHRPAGRQRDRHWTWPMAGLWESSWSWWQHCCAMQLRQVVLLASRTDHLPRMRRRQQPWNWQRRSASAAPGPRPQPHAQWQWWWAQPALESSLSLWRSATGPSPRPCGRPPLPIPRSVVSCEPGAHQAASRTDPDAGRPPASSPTTRRQQ
mmetsp:Transcript_33857/g.84972  ORF Transcript_33857/g.84972 Transcript_33857/m.84972 type:complete len:212 (+) Transcript_33857:185-820(+)